MLGKGEWAVAPKIVDALDDAFYLSFSTLEPTGKRFLIGVDVSGSMSSSCISSGIRDKHGRPISGPMRVCEGAAAMALAIAKVEPECYIHGFAGGAILKELLMRG